ncbi:MAG TPA: hypothetical protein ENK76_02385, partial [Campylobacterales bacterium]|nr:hypothetical protein [Campylobacterales bacterium]
MIRISYWIMALIEFIILLGTILLFALSDSRTIDIISKDILPQYGISYQEIHGNIFTGIKITSLEYNNTRLVDEINIRWNPIALLDNTIHITKLEIKNVNSNKIKEIFNSLPKSDNSKLDIFFDYKIDHIDITAKPLNYHQVAFKDFELGMKSIRVDRDIQKIKGKLLKLYLNSDLGNIGLHGEINKKRLHLNRVSLTDIDTKVITKFVKSFKKSKKNNKKIVKKDKPIILEYIKIDKLLASLKKTTYAPVTLEKTRLTLSNITIDLKSSYNINAKQAILIGKTNFADTKQVGYIKNSKLYTKGDIITREYLFNKYNLPLNRKELKRLPAKLELNQKGLWIEIDNSAKNILVLNSDFNLDIKKATHKLKYIYNEEKIYIHSKAKSSMTYSDDSDIDSLVLVDIAKDGYTTYEGKVDIKKIKGIPKDISSNLLENLKLKYKGDVEKLNVNINSKQAKGEFITKGYNNAKLTFHTKKSIYINKFIKNLPKPFNNSLADISSNSFIDFQDNKKTKIGLTLYSDIININSDIKITQPFKIKFNATIPNNSKISQIDKNIKLNAISKLDGLIILDKNSQNHISINSNDLSLYFNYNSKIDRLSRGVLNTAGEEIRFNGSLDKSINITTKIEDMNRFSKIVMRYYNIKLQKMRGKADIDIKLNPNTIDISLKSKKISYGDIEGDLVSKMNINKNSKIDIELNSKEIRYKKDTKIHALSTKFSILDNKIEIDRYSFKFYNDYISHFFSNKKSYLQLDNNTLYAKEVWLNDNILIRGDFNIDSMIGKLNIVSNSFSFKNRDFDLFSKFNLNLEIDKQRLFLSGLVEPLGNTITYEAIGSGIEEDSDIIIVQNSSQKNSTILDNLKMNLRIKNQKPIKYKTDNIDIEFSNDITIIKDYFKDFKVLGITTINRGYYKQENKKFFFDKSYIYFSGNPKKPILEVKATYNKEQYNIQIFISGTTQDPIINFN